MKTVTPDPMTSLAAYAPTEHDLDQEWTGERKTAVWDRVALAMESPDAARDADTVISAIPRVQHRISRRRSLITTAAIAAAVAAIVAVPLLLPSGTPGGPPSASALAALAATAADQAPLAPGQYLHVTTVSQQNGHVVTREGWTAADGEVWRVDTAAGTSTYYVFPPGGDDFGYPSPAFLKSLPTEPAALQRYLEDHVHGSSSRDEALFVAVGDMLRGGFAPPALRAAALRVLERTPHVTAAPGQDSMGRAATVVRFVDESIRPGEVQSLYFDPATAALVQEGLSVGDHSYSGTVTASDVVSSVPAQVLRYASDRGTCVTDQGVQPELTCAMAITAGGESTTAEAPPTSARPTS